MALNVESFDGKDFEEKDVTRTGFSFSRDYEMLTVQICLIGTYLKGLSMNPSSGMGKKLNMF